MCNAFKYKNIIKIKRLQQTPKGFILSTKRLRFRTYFHHKRIPNLEVVFSPKNTHLLFKNAFVILISPKSLKVCNSVMYGNLNKKWRLKKIPKGFKCEMISLLLYRKRDFINYLDSNFFSNHPLFNIKCLFDRIIFH